MNTTTTNTLKLKRATIAKLSALCSKKGKTRDQLVNEILSKKLNSYHFNLKNANKRWTVKEDNKLSHEYESITSENPLTEIGKIASKHGRTETAILGRLKTLGYLAYDVETNTYQQV